MGRTPLHYAAEKGHYEILQMLTDEFDAYIDVTDELECTPLHLACKEGHMSAVRYLVQSCGANLIAPDEVSTVIFSLFLYILCHFIYCHSMEQHHFIMLHKVDIVIF